MPKKLSANRKYCAKCREPLSMNELPLAPLDDADDRFEDLPLGYAAGYAEVTMTHHDIVSGTTRVVLDLLLCGNCARDIARDPLALLTVSYQPQDLYARHKHFWTLTCQRCRDPYSIRFYQQDDLDLVSEQLYSGARAAGWLVEDAKCICPRCRKAGDE